MTAAVLMMRRTSIMLFIDFWYKFNIHLFLCQLTNKKTAPPGKAAFLFILSKPAGAQKEGAVITWSVGSEAQQNDRR